MLLLLIIKHQHILTCELKLSTFIHKAAQICNPLDLYMRYHMICHVP